ncbi:TrmH family RNA methyltransferase [Tistrella sp. BH-R2-4]|uniref:TrmH family RNA methyltransferase n=2 Tax=Geminicoccaceae TaxID=2066434 RepID=A0ABU9YS04_9PROT
MEMRGFFAIGLEAVTRPMNAGTLFRAAHAFGAAYAFAISDAGLTRKAAQADTSTSNRHLPFFRLPAIEGLMLPDRAMLIGIEIDDALDSMPYIPHPEQAVYLIAPEGLSADARRRCSAVVRLPGRLALNPAMAGALVMYDRMLIHGRFAPRPVASSGVPGRGAGARHNQD